MSAGKGDKYRPVNKQKYDTNYDRIFRKDRRDKLPLNKLLEFKNPFSDPYIKGRFRERFLELKEQLKTTNKDSLDYLTLYSELTTIATKFDFDL